MTSVKRNPYYNEDEPLPLVEDIMTKTDSQRRDWFMSRWMDKVEPIERYSQFFEGADAGTNLAIVKNLYSTFVLEGDWTEYEYMTALDRVMSIRRKVSKESLIAAKDFLEREKKRRPERRRRRI